MPLIECPDCGGEISTEAKHCVHCGRPNRQLEETEQRATNSAPDSPTDPSQLYKFADDLRQIRGNEAAAYAAYGLIRRLFPGSPEAEAASTQQQALQAERTDHWSLPQAAEAYGSFEALTEAWAGAEAETTGPGDMNAPHGSRKPQSYPGEQVNSAVRLLGALTIIAAAALALWIAATAGESGLEAEIFGIPSAGVVFLNGLLAGALLVAFGAMGDNLIAIRREVERANLINSRNG